MSILKKVSRARVFSVNKLNNGKFEILERCDGHFEIDLSKEELIQLGEEIIEYAES